MRRRLRGEEAKAQILAVAGKHLRETGPSGFRLDPVAKELGVSRQAILHHFGNRDELILAVVRGTMDKLQGELALGFGALEDHEDTAAALLDHAYEAIVTGGTGRLLAWLALEYQNENAPWHAATQQPMRMLAQIADAMRARDMGEGNYEDTLFTLILAFYAVLGSAVFEESVLSSAGLSDDEAAPSRFRQWLSKLLVAHLEREI